MPVTANIIFGTVIDQSMKDTVKVTVIATGFDAETQNDVVQIDELPPIRKPTPPPMQVPQDTPPYLFESKGIPPMHPG